MAFILKLPTGMTKEQLEDLRQIAAAAERGNAQALSTAVAFVDAAIESLSRHVYSWSVLSEDPRMMAMVEDLSAVRNKYCQLADDDDFRPGYDRELLMEYRGSQDEDPKWEDPALLRIELESLTPGNT